MRLCYSYGRNSGSIFVSGEGIVAEFAGPGEILIQTRNLAALAGLLKPFFPSQSGGGGFSLGQ